MPRTLRLQLTVTFTLVNLLVLTLLSGVVFGFGRQTYLNLKREQVRLDIVNNVRTHYQLRGTLAGLTPQERPPEETASPGHRQDPPGQPPFIVLDSQYRVAADVPGTPRGTPVPVTGRDLTAVRVQGRVVAYLLPTGTPPQPDATSRAFLNRAGLALAACTLLTLTLAVTLGVLLSRPLLAPL
ncbi:hypothetical protein [Deinococcus knuensis]|uniref:Two-component sensor histidine kinase n=1 Tax=Deinococcus knuensis TaxID=1837380 RepID=A0ABQ2SEL4_9DEIO|nr:hypothetical protein [Deinococcus knuensis]GGS25842.1 hypothetical protein GCM10008961_16660 [Deinococcus knuensis]